MSSFDPIEFDALMKGKTVLLAADAGERMEAIANTMLLQGAEVFCVEKNGLDADLKGCHMLTADLSDLRQASETVDRVLAASGRLDSIIFCLDPISYCRAEEITEDYTDKLYRSNLKSLMNLVSRGVIPMKKQRGGTLVTVTTDYADTALPLVSVYAGIAAGMKAYARNVAMECCKYEIRANNVMPGFNVGQNGEAYRKAHPDEDVEDSFTRYQPLPRRGTENDVAQCVLFCASPMSNSISGESFPVDGGVCVIGHANVWNPIDKPVYSTWRPDDKKTLTIDENEIPEKEEEKK